MPIVRKSCIEDIKSRVNILDVVSATVTLRKAGSSYKGLSPFNQEKTPSFFVSPEKGLYKCFSSGKAGDIFDFVMETERLSFGEAVEALAGRFNIDLQYEEGGGQDHGQRSIRQELLLIHELAVDYYHRALLAATPEASQTRTYWEKQRGFPMAVAIEHNIGLSPLDQKSLIALCRRRGISYEAIKECGLFYQRGTRTDDSSLFPRFRGRLMIPIRDHQGRPIAFTARQLDLTPKDDPTHEAKYVNSPETPLFHKSRVMFGLEKARMAAGENKPFLLVEGQLDTLRCWQHGLDTAVAPQGTAVTEEQLRLLRRYAPGVDCLLDGDSAGQKAALRFLPAAFQAGLDVRFFLLPPNEDPDSLLLRAGVAGWEEIAKRPNQPIRFAINALIPNLAEATPQQKAQAAEALFEMVGRAESEVARTEYIREAATVMKLDWSSLSLDFHRFVRQKIRRRPPPATSPETASPSLEKLTRAEETLLHICLHDSELGKRIASVVETSWVSPEHRAGRLLNLTLAELEHDQWEGTQSILDLVDDEADRNMIHSMAYAPPDHDDAEKVANEAIRRLHKSAISREIDEIDLALAQTASMVDRAVFLQRKRNEYRRMLLSPPRVPARGFCH